MKTKEMTLLTIAIVLMSMTVAIIIQTNKMIEQNNRLINVEYSRCVNAMHKVGDRCSK